MPDRGGPFGFGILPNTTNPNDATSLGNELRELLQDAQEGAKNAQTGADRAGQDLRASIQTLEDLVDVFPDDSPEEDTTLTALDRVNRLQRAAESLQARARQLQADIKDLQQLSVGD